ncbi:unnamed protein product [Chrysoparadoxa australica]
MTTVTKGVFQQKWGGQDVLRFGEMPLPSLNPTDILVRNYASGTNPVDYKAREGFDPSAPIDPARPVVLGWDGAGVVEAVGSAVTKFQVGDAVMYAGDLTRPGSYSELTVVDARITAFKPKTLTFAEASTIPLVALTAMECIKEIIHAEEGETILIFNGAGGVGSFAIQYAKAMGLKVIATASRPETIQWVKDLGADTVVNHRESVPEQLEAAGVSFNHLLHLRDCEQLPELIKAMAPFGTAAMIGIPSTEVMASIDTMNMFFNRKSMGLEIMFARSSTGVKPEKQGALLREVAALIDAGKIKHTITSELPMENVKEAHQLLEAGRAMGKTVLIIDEVKAHEK